MISTYISQIDQVISNQYDRFLEEGLQPYGIMKENIVEQRGRVYRERISRPDNPFRYVDNIYIDGKHAFSIETTLMFGGTRVDINVELVKGESS